MLEKFKERGEIIKLSMLSTNIMTIFENYLKNKKKSRNK